MDVPLAGMNIFRADRVTDVHEAATAIRRAMKPHQLLAGVGYSMGAIVLSNYVATFGSDCALSAAFSISGALDCRYEMDFARPKRLWQPMIAEYSRERHLNKWGERMKQRLGKDKLIGFLRATNVVELDQYLAVEHYRPRYKNLKHYYEEMGALGDIPSDVLESSDDVSHVLNARIHNVSIPLCVMHAFDDPIATWRGVAANEGFLHPNNLVRSGQGNILLLLTERGGHVGWPVGWFSFQNDWQFMSEAASSFVEAVARSQQELMKQTQERHFIVEKDGSIGNSGTDSSNNGSPQESLMKCNNQSRIDETKCSSSSSSRRYETEVTPEETNLSSSRLNVCSAVSTP